VVLPKQPTEWSRRSRATGAERRRLEAFQLLLLSLVSVGALGGLPPENGQGESRAREERVLVLSPGSQVERDFAAGEVHWYRFSLTAGQFLYLVIDQQGVDAAGLVEDPDGRRVGEFDARWYGPEPVLLIAAASGRFALQIRAVQQTGVPARYQLRMQEVRNARPDDQSLIAMAASSTEAKQLLAQGTATSVRAALERYEQVLPLWQAAGDRQGEAQVLNTMGHIRHRLGEIPKALEHLNRALALRQELGDRRGASETLVNLAAAHSTLGDKHKALAYYHEALPLKRAVGDQQGLAFALANLANVYYTLGENHRALELFTESLPLWRGIQDRRGEVQTLIGMAVVHAVLGERQQALDCYHQALPVVDAIGDRRGKGYVLLNQGRLYEEIGERQNAQERFAEARELMRVVGDRRGEGAALASLCGYYVSMADAGQAREYCDEALQALRQAGDRGLEAFTLVNLSRLHHLAGDGPKALAVGTQALTLMRAVRDRRGEGIALYSTAVAHAYLKESQRAAELYQQALDIHVEVGDRGMEVAGLYGLAKTESELGKLAEARRHIESALGVIESLRIRVGSPELRASYFASVRACYEFYVGLLMRLHGLHPAEGYDVAGLEASERARARNLLETLIEARADIRQGVDRGLVEEERRLQQQINARSESLMRWPGGASKEKQLAVRKEIEELLAAYREVQAQIRIRSPGYAALTQPKPMRPSEIQLALDGDTLLLEYTLGEQQSFLWAVTRQQVRTFALPPRSTIEDIARRLYELLTARNQPFAGETIRRRQERIALADAEYPKAAAALSAMILGPAAKQLTPATKRLVIVAEGALQYVPFGALPGPEVTPAGGRAGSGSGWTPLMVGHEVVSLPSASVLGVLRRDLVGRKPAPRMMAVMADPVFDPDDSRVKTSAVGARASRAALEPDLARAVTETGVASPPLCLPRLPFTRQEAELISALVPVPEALKRLDFSASKSAVLRGELGQSRLVHLATHGMLNSEHPELSGLVLSLVDERGQPQDGFLRLHEVYNLQLPAQLVVLSACQTALGKDIKGEGMVGLTRGFMYAGAPRVVASLWKVHDEATAYLMKAFYGEMLGGAGRPPAAALRAAQQAVWREKRWRFPYYWAGFLLQGEWR